MTKQYRLTTDLLNSPFSKFGVGFDRLFNDILDNPTFSQTGSGYPPYNVARITNDDKITYEIILAVAGFTEEDISITVENQQLHIAGQSASLDHGDAYEYIHKGIAERNFIRSFKLAENVEVESAELKDGLLRVTLVSIIPEEKQPKRISITRS